MPPVTLLSPRRKGVLKAGDRILKVNGADVSGCSQMETLSLLRASGDTCALQIQYNVALHGTLLLPHSATLFCLSPPPPLSLLLLLLLLLSFLSLSSLSAEILLEPRGPLHVELQKPRGVSLGIRLTQRDDQFWISHVKEAGIADR